MTVGREGIIQECDTCGQSYNQFINDECPKCAVEASEEHGARNR